MQIHRKSSGFPEGIKPVLTLGMFDGVHLGHQFVIKFLEDIACKEAGEAAIITFDPHPRLVLQHDSTFKLITTLEEKIHLLEKFSVKHLFIQEFTKEFSQLSALEFVRDILVAKLNIHSLVIGYDHQFGRNRDGDFEQLEIFSKMFDFKLYRLPSVSEHETVISSTKIRKQIEEGDIQKANEWLGYHFLLTGKVVEGDKIGRTIGFPTANLLIDPNKICPKNGVYFVKVKAEGKEYNGMMNIGKRPTVNGLKKQIEVHILDFNKDIYGKEIQISFYYRERDEQKFSSIEQLKKQLTLDKQKTEEYFKKN